MEAVASSGAWGRDSQQNSLRKGKWTLEEENYANKIIDLFNHGRLPIMAGTTLRSYLSDKLRCDPMRITKKYAGTSCIGKQIFQPNPDYLDDAEAMRQTEVELSRMEQLFLMRVSSRSVLVEDDGLHGSSSAMEALRRNTPRNCLKTDIAGGFASEITPAARWKGKRVRSAPDLMELCSTSITGKAGMGGELRLLKPESLEQVEMRVQIVGSSSFTPSSQSSATSSRLWVSGLKKRSHSVMALMDFENLVSDDNAASELFLEFVAHVGEKRRASYQTQHPHHAMSHIQGPSREELGLPWIQSSALAHQVAQDVAVKPSASAVLDSLSHRRTPLGEMPQSFSSSELQVKDDPAMESKFATTLCTTFLHRDAPLHVPAQQPSVDSDFHVDGDNFF